MLHLYIQIGLSVILTIALLVICWTVSPFWTAIIGACISANVVNAIHFLISD